MMKDSLISLSLVALLMIGTSMAEAGKNGAAAAEADAYAKLAPSKPYPYGPMDAGEERVAMRTGAQILEAIPHNVALLQNAAQPAPARDQAFVDLINDCLDLFNVAGERFRGDVPVEAGIGALRTTVGAINTEFKKEGEGYRLIQRFYLSNGRGIRLKQVDTLLKDLNHLIAHPAAQVPHPLTAADVDHLKTIEADLKKIRTHMEYMINYAIRNETPPEVLA